MPAPRSRRTFLTMSALFASSLVTGCTTSSFGETEANTPNETIETTMDNCESDTILTPSEPVKTRGAIVQNNDASEHTVSLQLFVFESSEFSGDETREVSDHQRPCRSVKVSERETRLDSDGETTFDSFVPVYDDETNYWLTVTIDDDASSAFVFSAADETELGYLAIDIESTTEASLRIAVQ